MLFCSAGAFSAGAFVCWRAFVLLLRLTADAFFILLAFVVADALFCCHVVIRGCYHKLHDGRKLVFVVL